MSSNKRKMMDIALKKVVIPVLRRHEFKGSPTLEIMISAIRGSQTASMVPWICDFRDSRVPNSVNGTLDL